MRSSKNLPVVRAVRTILRQRRYFGSTRDWLVRWLDGLLKRLPALRHLSPGPVWRIRARGYADPFVVRKASKDWVALRETIFEDEYGGLVGRLPEVPGTILDLGANIGMTVRVWLDRFPEARIAAVEPDPGNLELCRLNVEAAGGADRVTLLQCCAAARPGRLFLDRSGQPMEYRTRPGPITGATEVTACTVPEILQQSVLDSVSLLKCDIEGTERELFRGCRLWIRRVRFLMVELHAPYNRTQLVADLLDSGVRPDVIEGYVKHRGTELALLAILPRDDGDGRTR